MFLERRSVSRKTPGDGKLEISEASARPLLAAGAPLVVSLEGRDAGADVQSMVCTCRKAGGQHTHWFLQSDLLKSLSPDDDVALEFDRASAKVSIAVFHPNPEDTRK